MREHPIIFSGPMIRAILEGRKTMTRRLAKNAPENWGQVTKMSNPGSFMLHFNRGVKQVQCPYSFRSGIQSTNHPGTGLSITPPSGLSHLRW